MQRRTLLFVSTLALALLGGIRSSPLYKRFGGDGTFYTAGLGACGDTNSNKDMVCAMNAAQYPGSCNKVISITGPKGTVTCVVKDLCPECLFGSVDMTTAVFDKIADEVNGRVKISWNFVDDNPQPSPQPSPQPPPPPPPQQSPQPPPPQASSDPKQVQKDTVTDNNSTDVSSVSYAFISADFSLINGGELAEGGNPLDDPDGYSSEILADTDDGCDVDQSDDSDDDDGDDDDGDDEDDDDQPCNAQPATDTDS